MRSLPTFIPLLAFTVFLIFSSCQTTQESPNSVPQEIPDSTNILALAKDLQRVARKPTENFRPGHVSPKQMKDYLEKRDGGFAIQLPKRSLTPSPTIYNGLLLVSGGFGSKEYYAFDAVDGSLKWALDLDDDGPTSAVVEDDIVVFNTESCTIFACNALTGEYLWSHYLGDPLMSTPSISEGIVYTSYPAGSEPADTHSPSQQSEEAPSIQQSYGTGPAYATVKDSTTGHTLRASHVMIAMELETGKILWQKWIDGDVMSAPVIEGNELFATTFPGTLYRFDARTGEILAAQASRATSAPVVHQGNIYMSRRSEAGRAKAEENLTTLSKDLNIVASTAAKKAPYLEAEVQNKSKLKTEAANYDAGNGFAAGAPANSGWRNASANIGQSNVSSLQAFQGSRVLHHQNRNYATMGDELVCADPSGDKVYWKQKLKGDLKEQGGFLATPPLLVDNKIIVGTLEGDVIIFEAGTGKEWKRFKTGENIRYQPVLDQGRLYVSTVGGKVLCFDTGRKELTDWPTWGANAAHTNRIP